MSIEEERLRRACYIIAKIIERDGTDYLPIYERLEMELEKINRRNSALDRALAMARNVA